MDHIQHSTADIGELDVSFWTLTLPLTTHWRLLVAAPLAAGALAVAATFLIEPEFSAKASFLPPQQQQSAAATALSQLGALSNLAGGGVRSTTDQFVSLLQSETVAQRMVLRFELQQLYETRTLEEARDELGKRARMSSGKKDGLISVEVLDRDPVRAAAMANAFIEELRRLSSSLALTEAQKRRVFFEEQMRKAGEQLEEAQLALQESGFHEGAIKAEPKATAEGFARLNAELTAAEIRLQALRSTLTNSTPEVLTQLATVENLRMRLARIGKNDQKSNADANYIGRFREFKYRETLFEVFARQYEMARVDEAKEGGFIQVIDTAMPPERKVSPRRGVIGVTSALLTMLSLALGLVAAGLWRITGRQPQIAQERRRWLESLGRR